MATTYSTTQNTDFIGLKYQSKQNHIILLMAIIAAMALSLALKCLTYTGYAIARWQVILVYWSKTWSSCNCMNDHAVTAWSCWTAAPFHWFSMIMLQLHAWSCCNCMIMLQLHWLIHLFSKFGGALCSVGYNLDQLCWFGLRIYQSDLQLGITIADLLVPSPPYVSQSAYIYPALRQQNTREVIKLLDFFSPMTILGVKILRSIIRKLFNIY